MLYTVIIGNCILSLNNTDNTSSVLPCRELRQHQMPLGCLVPPLPLPRTPKEHLWRIQLGSTARATSKTRLPALKGWPALQSSTCPPTTKNTPKTDTQCSPFELFLSLEWVNFKGAVQGRKLVADLFHYWAGVLCFHREYLSNPLRTPLSFQRIWRYFLILHWRRRSVYDQENNSDWIQGCILLPSSGKVWEYTPYTAFSEWGLQGLEAFLPHNISDLQRNE